MDTPIDDNIIFVSVVAGSVIKENDKILLVQERKPKAFGLWNLPTGKVEKGYTIEETAIKEIREESGYKAEVLRKLAIYHRDGDEAIKHVFEAKITGGDISERNKEEIMDVRWFTLSEIAELFIQDKIRDDWVMEAITVSLVPNDL